MDCQEITIGKIDTAVESSYFYNQTTILKILIVLLQQEKKPQLTFWESMVTYIMSNYYFMTTFKLPNCKCIQLGEGERGERRETEK